MSSAGTKVFVGNLAYSTTEEDLHTAFEKCGKVLEAKVVRRGNRSKGYGFVDFEEESDAQKSVDALDKVELNGRSINVQLSTSTNTGEDGDGDGDSKVRRNDENRPRNNNYGGGNFRRNNNYGGGRYNNNNNGNFRRNNWNNRDDNRGGNRGGNRDGNRDDNRDNRGNRDDNRGDSGSPSGRKTYSLRKNFGNENNNENRRRYTRSTAEKVESLTVVFVANLPYSFYDEDLVDLFKQCGDIKTAHVVRTRGKSKGYGFVEFQAHEGQVAALEKMDNFTVENSRGEERNLTVKVAMQAGDEQVSETVKDNDNEDDDDEEGEKNDD